MMISQPFPILLSQNPNTHYYYYYIYNFSNSLYVVNNTRRRLWRCSTAAKRDRADSFRFLYDEDEENDRVNYTKRVWWDDNNVDFEDDDDEGEGGGGFGVLQDSFDTTWLFKVLNAFGWMVPAFGISMLLGTSGTNTFFMALVLPLAQSVVSFISDTFLGDSVRSSKTKRRRAKKKPFRRSQNGTNMKGDTNTDKVNDTYQFRNAKENKPRATRASSFGGWDELDKGLGSYTAPRREPTRMENELGLANKSKLSRRVRTRGTPLLARLLIAVFPSLGTWTRLL